MIKQYPFDKKHQRNDDDEQVKKTLHFFDSILNQYLPDQDKIPNKNILNHPTTSSSTSSSSSSSAGYNPALPYRHRRYVRRYTSENSLHEIPLLSKPKFPSSRTRQTTATSTDDLTIKSPSNLIKQISNGASASLIDLSSIDKFSSKPRFRFVPSLNENHILKEEPESEPEFQLKTISSNQTKPSHQIVKPTVIIPPIPKSAPINRLIETNIHHQNGNSAFKPPQSNRNGISSKIEPIKRTESNVHVGITNPNNQSFDNSFPLRKQQSAPQPHQSSLNVSSPELVNKNRLPPRISVQRNKLNGYHPFRSGILQEPISKWIQQGTNQSQHQTYPHSSYTSPNTGISSTVNNHRQQTYYNPITIRKYPIPIQSVYPTSPSGTRNGRYLPSSNVYNFNQPRDGQSRRHPYRQNIMSTTYL